MKGMLLFLLLLLMVMLVISDGDDVDTDGDGCDWQDENGNDGDSDGDDCDWEDGVEMMVIVMVVTVGKMEEEMMVMKMMAVSCQVLVPTSKSNPLFEAIYRHSKIKITKK